MLLLAVSLSLILHNIFSISFHLSFFIWTLRSHFYRHF
jgi:hypothetical protein